MLNEFLKNVKYAIVTILGMFISMFIIIEGMVYFSKISVIAMIGFTLVALVIFMALAATFSERLR